MSERGAAAHRFERGSIEREMADMLDLPLGTVKSRCSRARVELARVVGGLIGPGPEAEATS